MKLGISKSLISLLVTMITVSVLLSSMSTLSLASPGAVNKQGCHSKPRHCHPLSHTSKMKNGRRFVPWGQG